MAAPATPVMMGPVAQVAAAFCQIQRGNAEGAAANLQKARERLRGPEPAPVEVNASALLGIVTRFITQLEARGAPPDFPALPLR